MDRQETAVEYRQQLRCRLSDCLDELSINALTLIELSDLLHIVEPAVDRYRSQHQHVP
jgi:hypothetical protein